MSIMSIFCAALLWLQCFVHNKELYVYPEHMYKGVCVCVCVCVRACVRAFVRALGIIPLMLFVKSVLFVNSVLFIYIYYIKD